ncbi:class I SAM-dependent methyltransferase [Rufibacter psychrotolerans]|uniref:class I SAM-dependent methyltransferase n=1 Tax=Rufibacter psychrotolerans TaxID=2812556 RepID=UPI001967D8EC|nr:class I SAM-dependent methyltransferase [Rufibacter sp. SYSU D00308]
MNQNRDYTTISPSAAALLLLKAQTQLPYAREAARLLFTLQELEDSFDRTHFGAWASVVHFEHRYATVQQLILESGLHQLLELSSGFSFRGQALVQQGHVRHCIDTDLPDLIEKKAQLCEDLHLQFPAGSRLELQALDVMDRAQFLATVDRFAPGPLAIVTEGLLVYLSRLEREQLCQTIRAVLQARGGCWITSDIYLQHAFVQRGTQQANAWEAFFRQEGVPDQLFTSFEEAEQFFYANGLVVDKVAAPAYDTLSAVPNLLAVATEPQLQALRTGGQIQATWRLRCR